MLEPEEFKIKYDTDRKQRREESFLEEVGEEDRELYSDLEILTGLNPRGQINKFFQNGQNKGKKYPTLKKRWLAHFKKYVDTKIANGEADAIFAEMWEEALGGDFRHLQYMFDRITGKVKEQIEVKTEENITFIIDQSKLIDIEDKKETSE